jgi:hypothetical protein
VGSNPESVLVTLLYIFYIVNRGQREERKMLKRFFFKGDKNTVPQLRLLVARFPPLRPEFDPSSCGICGSRSCFLRVLRFPLPNFIPPTVPHSSSSIIRGWYNRPTIGRRAKWSQDHPNPRKFWRSKIIYILKKVNENKNYESLLALFI